MSLQVPQRIAPLPEVVAQLRAEGFGDHPVALVLGSGLSLASPFVRGAERPYATIPGFPTAGVAGHKGLLSVWSAPAGTSCLVFEGRPHLYEGWSMEEVVFPVRLMHALGVRTLIITNAAGGLSPSFEVGDFILLTDHLSLFPPGFSAPGVADRDRWRADSGSSPYNAPLRESVEAGWPAALRGPQTGVYAAVLGPNYETASEIRVFGELGADLIGMSTAAEAVMAHHLGLRVLGLSFVSNSLARPPAGPLTHLEVLEAGKAAAAHLGAILQAAWPTLVQVP